MPVDCKYTTYKGNNQLIFTTSYLVSNNNYELDRFLLNYSIGGRCGLCHHRAIRGGGASFGRLP